MKIKHIKIPLYRDCITVVICTKEEMLTLGKKWKIRSTILNDIDDCKAATLHPVGRDVTIWTQHLKCFSELGHEVIHASMGILRRAGVRVDEDNHEALTYLFTYICDQMKL